MKLTLLALALGLMSVTGLVAQEASIRVSSVVHADGTQTHTTTDLDARTSEVKTVNAAGKMLRRTVYKLDDDGNPAEGTHYSAKNAPTYRFVFTRDSLGRVAEEKDYTLDGKLFQRLVYRFNTAGKVIGIDTYDAQGKLVGSSGGTKKQQPTRQQPARRTR